MFKLILQDSYGNSLKQGDVVRIISDRRENQVFYCEVKYLEKEKSISPFHTFSFHRLKKVKLPEDAILLDNPNFKVWMKKESSKEDIKSLSKYLIDWRVLESRINEGCFIIEPLNT